MAWKEQVDIADKLSRAVSDRVLKYPEQSHVHDRVLKYPEQSHVHDANLCLALAAQILSAREELEKYLYVHPEDEERLDKVTNALWTINKFSSSPETVEDDESVDLSPVERGIIQLGDPDNYPQEYGTREFRSQAQKR